MSDPKWDDLGAHTLNVIAPVIRGCLDQGFVPPLRVAIIFANGSALVYELSIISESEGKLEGNEVSEYRSPNTTTIYPINMMIVDSMGEPQLVTIGPDSKAEGN